MLTFVDHFSKRVEAYPIPDITAETCARMYPSQILTRHGTGSALITGQGRSSMSALFKETCKILGIWKVNTSSYHPSSNGMVERWHRSLHSGLSRFIDAADTNWDHLVPFFKAYLSTPNTTTGFSPYYLLHGRQMVLPNSNDLKSQKKILTTIPD